MTIEDFMGVKRLSSEGFWRKVVEKLGYDRVKKCVPFTLKQLKGSKDYHFNDLSMKKWDYASGYIWTRTDYDEIMTRVHTRLTELYRENGITCWSNSDGVCILKECARMMLEECGE